VSQSDLACDGQTQTGSTVSPAACAIDAGELLENSFPLSFGHTFAVVSDDEFDMRVTTNHLKLDGCGRMLLCVVQQSLQDSNDLRGNRSYEGVRRHPQLYRKVIGSAKNLSSGQIDQVQFFVLRRRTGPQTGEQEQIAHDRFETIDTFQRPMERSDEVGLFRVQ
jgi:hypothetical protein